MNKVVLLNLLIIIILLCACSSNLSLLSNDEESNNGFDNTESVLPAQEYTNSTSIGINVEIVGTDFWHKETIIDWITYNEGEIEANLAIANGSKGITQAGVIVLTDGVPVKFRLEGEGYDVMHFFDLEGEIIKKIHFIPEFYAEYGRIDIYVLCNTQKISNDRLWGVSFTILVDLENTTKIQSNTYIPNAKVVELRKGLQETYGTIHPEGISSVSGWIFPAMLHDIITLLDGVPGETTVSLQGSQEIWFECATRLPGRYRVALFINYEPAELYEESSVFDFFIDLNEMLSINFDLSNFIDDTTASFFVIITEIEVASSFPYTYVSNRYIIQP